MQINQYDAIVIGAGMSGLAAGIRLAMFDKKVCIIEKHSIPGGLNSYYRRKKTQSDEYRLFDAGLHALTNFIKKGERGKPFSKLLKQLRLSYDDFKLKEQSQSQIVFPEKILTFNNNFSFFREEFVREFPKQAQGFDRLVVDIEKFDELNLNNQYRSSKETLKNYFDSELAIEMLICPLLIYGSAWENDMDFSQFVIMFKSIYQEGFSRPEGGVRTILQLLVDKFTSLGGEFHYRTPVEKILTKNKKTIGVLTSKGEFLAEKIFSSMGLPETLERLDEPVSDGIQARVGKLSFMECLICLDKKIAVKDFNKTILFYNNSSKYYYRRPDKLFDPSSAVFCCPDNYDLLDRDGEGMIRVTYMANYDLWKKLERENYLAQKETVFEEALKLTRKLIPSFNQEIVFKDVFSPTTIEKYTWHKDGTVYGSIDKSRKGLTPIEGLYIIGTDQGFLGIVGSMLSGISMANLHGLMVNE